MACDRMRELAWLEIDGELTDAERAELAAHVEQCADCRAARAAATRVVDGVRRLAPPPVPIGFAERTIKRLEEAAAPRRRRPLPWIVPLAAAAATIVAAAVFVVERHRAPPASGFEVAAGRKEEPSQERARDADKADGFVNDAPAAQAPAKEPEGEVRRFGDESRILQLEDDAGDLLAQLAQGEPADALERISARPVRGRLSEPLHRNADERLEKERGQAKDDEKAANLEQPLAGALAPAPAPALRFLRIRGDPKKVEAILAEDARARRTPHDVAGRGVVDLDEAGEKPLRERFAAAGLVCEELTAEEWLRAAKAAENEKLAFDEDAAHKAKEGSGKAGGEKRPEAPKPQTAPDGGRSDDAQNGVAKKTEPAKGEERKDGAKSLDATAGKAGAAAPTTPAVPGAPAPRRVERIFFLIQK